MAQLPYSELVPDVAPIAKGAPFPTIIRNAQRAAIDFYKSSKAYKQESLPIDLVADQGEYTFVPRYVETTLYVPLDMYVAKRRLDTVSDHALSLDKGDWRLAGSGTVRGIFKSGVNKLTVFQTPKAAVTGGLTGTVAVVPERLAAGLEEEYMQEHGDFIVYGIAARLLEMRGTTWFDGELSSYYRQLFNNAIMDAAKEVTNANTSRVRYTTYGGI